MNTSNTNPTTLREVLESIDISGCDVDITDALSQHLDTLISDLPSADDLREKVIDSINEQEVIYYSTAMKDLSEKDPSLMDSLALAEEYGYAIADLNSELLATLLYQDELRQALDEVWPQVEEAINEVLENEEE